jgi:hypothetical protein
MRTLLRTVAGFALSAVCCTGTFAVAAQRGNESRQSPPAAAPDLWRVAFVLSGGLAGADRTVEVVSTGELSAVDRKRGTHISRQATKAELVQIKSLLDAVTSTASPRPGTRCRDCLAYALEIERKGERSTTVVDDTNLAGSGFESLVNALTALLNGALAKN